jgi:hypothetical protein
VDASASAFPVDRNFDHVLKFEFEGMGEDSETAAKTHVVQKLKDTYVEVRFKTRTLL